MAESTGISWADATLNPWVGCSKVSPGCAHCYAETLVTGRMGRAGTWGETGVRERTSAALWAKPHRWNRLALEGRLPNGSENKDGHRPRIFCASLADVFEPRPELEPWRHELFALIEQTPDLDWLLLTKRPEEARDWLRRFYVEYGARGVRSTNAGQLDLSTGAVVVPEEVEWETFGREWTSRDYIGWGCLPNVWIGTSIENSRFTWRADILRQIPAAVRFISAEPLLGSLYTVRPPREIPATLMTDAELTEGVDDFVVGPRAPLDLSGIDWVIVGGESGGTEARPMHPGWAREIRDAVLARGGDAVASFDYVGPDQNDQTGERWEEIVRPALHMKQWGSWTPDPDGRDPNGRWVSPDGRSRSSFAADAYDDLSDGSVRMRYAGAAPHSGGKYLDGVDWCEFPERALTPA